NQYRETLSTGALEAIAHPLGPGGVGIFELSQAVQAASSDLSHVVLQTEAHLTENASAGHRNVYESDRGKLRLAGLLPDKRVPPTGSTTPTSGDTLSAISRDGSKIFFEASPDESTPQLYERKNASETIWISQPEGIPPNPNPLPVTFQAASADGHSVAFMTE